MLKKPVEIGVEEVMRKLAMKHGASVRRLMIQSAKLESFEFLSEVLGHFPLLRELNLKGVTFASSSNTKLKLKILKSLTLSSDEMLQHLECPQITHLVLKGLWATTNCLNNFLKASHKLESITFSRRNYVQALKQPEKFPFKLKSFSWNDYNSDDQDDGTLIKFLESQASTLQRLKLCAVSEELYSAIVTKLNHLKYLELNAFRLSSDESFYQSFTPLRSLEEFKLVGSFIKEPHAKFLLKNFSNVQKIAHINEEWNGVFNLNELLEFIAMNNPKVQSFPMLKFEPARELNYMIPALKSLEIEEIKNAIDLFYFFTKHSLQPIERLKVHYMDATQLEFLDGLLNYSDLKSLTIGGIFNTCKAVYQKVKVKGNRKNLQTVDFEIYYHGQGYDEGDDSITPRVGPDVTFKTLVHAACAEKVFQYDSLSEFINATEDTGVLYKRPRTLRQLFRILNSKFEVIT